MIRDVEADFAAGMFRPTWVFEYPDGRKSEHTGCTRMYLPRDISRMLEICGFRDIRLVGGTDGEPFEMDSPRLILFGVK